MNYNTAHEIERAVALHLGTRQYVIVPNLSWGMFMYEMDLCALNHKSMYATEVEIKVSKSDLKRDQKKSHNHDINRNMIKYLYFAMPERMRDCFDLVPERAGIFLVDENGVVTCQRKPVAVASARKWTHAEAYELGRLGTIRMWDAKAALSRTEKGNKTIIAENADLRRRNIDLEATIADLLRDLNQKNLDVFGGE